MARSMTETSAAAIFPAGTGDFLKRRLSEVVGVALLAGGVASIVALASFSPDDPSFNSSGAGTGAVKNLMGFFGAAVSDTLLQVFGLAATLPVVALLSWGWLALRKRGPGRMLFRFPLLLLAALFTAAAIAAMTPLAGWPLLSGMGGAAGDALWRLVPKMLALVPCSAAVPPVYVAAAIGVLGAVAAVAALGLSWRDARAGLRGAVAVGAALHDGYKFGRDAIGGISEKVSDALPDLAKPGRGLTAWSPIRFGSNGEEKADDGSRVEPSLSRGRSVDDPADDDNDAPAREPQLKTREDLVAPRAAKPKP
ncbi:MAG: hypothetical protein FJX42_09885, partial [Alphaproteobacteria bacterium]|nr:hypothetical protein [Alphaproteobacteria bacterium]